MIKTKSDTIWRLENDNQRLKIDLQTIKQCESDLRSQLAIKEKEYQQIQCDCRSHRGEIDNLQKRLQAINANKQSDKQTIQRLEKQLEQEIKRKNELQAELEKKGKNFSNDSKGGVLSGTIGTFNSMMLTQSYKNCSEPCRAKMSSLESEIVMLKQELKNKSEKLKEKEKVNLF